jgi:hypothetical protein
MPQHPGKVFLLEVLFMSAQLQVKEAFTLSLFYQSSYYLERRLNGVLSPFSKSFLEEYRLMKDLRETIS